MALASNQGGPSSSGVQSPASELMFKERSEDECERLQLAYGGDEQFIDRVRQILSSVFRGDLEELKRLMVGVESVNIALKNELQSATPLILAAAVGHVEIVKWIRDTRPERNMNALYNDGGTALCAACKSQCPGNIIEEVVTELLLADDIDANLGGQWSPLARALAKGRDWSVIDKLLAWNSNTYPPINIHFTNKLGWNALHATAYGGNVDVIEKLMNRYPDLDVCQADNDGNLPLHLAACSGKPLLTKKLLALKPDLINNTANEWRSTPLHYAVLSNSSETVEAILKGGGKDLKVDQQDWEGSTPLDYAKSWYIGRKLSYNGLFADQVYLTRENAKEMIRMLEGFDIDGLRTERQVYVDSANAILVGGALIVGVAFSSCLQPPLGLTPYYESQFLMPSPSPPDTYESFAAIRDYWTIGMFWVFNTLSFFFAVATIIGGADAALPKRGLLLKDAVRQVRHAVLQSCCLLVVSMVCVIGAFTSAGFTVLPPIYKYQKGMIGSVCIGVMVCMYVLWKVIVKVFSWTSLEEIREHFTSFVGHLIRFRNFLVVKYNSCIRKICHNV